MRTLESLSIAGEAKERKGWNHFQGSRQEAEQEQVEETLHLVSSVLACWDHPKRDNSVHFHIQVKSTLN